MRDNLRFGRVGREAVGGKNGAVVRLVRGAKVCRHQVLVVKFRE